MKIQKISLMTLLMSSVMIAAVSCTKSDSSSNAPSNMIPTTKAISLQSNATLGNYLVDNQNRTLYFFSDDPNGMNNCTGSCEAFWPAFNVDNLGAGNLGTGLNIADFGSTTTRSGSRQTTYKGWPLYYYAPVVNGSNVQEGPGQVQGEGVDNVWFVAKPDYSIMLVNAQLLGHDGKDYKSDYTEGLGTTTYFTDDRGRTLYTYIADKLNKNNYTSADFSNNDVWPLYETSAIVVPSILDKTKFGSINVFGRTQLTYNGWPLYYFGPDGQTRGSNKGISFPSPGIWPVPNSNTGRAPQ